MLATCSCQNCKTPIQFKAEEFNSEKTLKCPHCGKETSLSMPLVGKFFSAESLPALFAVVLGSIYATGFLVQFTFLNSMGIKESVTEVFKAKYIYLGLLCWQFPVCAALMLFGYFGYLRKKKCRAQSAADASPRKTLLYFPSIFMMLLLLLTFYLIMIISPPGFFHRKQGIIFGFFAFVIVSFLIIRLFEDMEYLKTPLPHLPQNFERYLANLKTGNGWTFGKVRFFLCSLLGASLMLLIFFWLSSLCTQHWGALAAECYWFGVYAIMAGLIIWMLGRWRQWPYGQMFRFSLAFIMEPIIMGVVFSSSSFWRRLWEMLANEGYWYYIFASMAGLIIWATDHWNEAFKKEGLKMEFWNIMLPIVFTFFFLSVLSFAYHIYPYIPVERGGGDYTTEKASILTFDPQLANSIPTEVFDQSHHDLQSKKAVILDETANAIIFTIPKSTNLTGVMTEIRLWRRNTPDTRPQRIFVVKREAVVSPRSGPWGSLMFSYDDFTNFPSFAARLKHQPQDFVSAYLNGRLSVATSNALANYEGTNVDLMPLQSALVQDLNVLINGNVIYDENRFHGVFLRPETKELLAHNQQGEALVRLNRLLLGDAYPQEILTDQPW